MSTCCGASITTRRPSVIDPTAKYSVTGDDVVEILPASPLAVVAPPLVRLPDSTAFKRTVLEGFLDGLLGQGTAAQLSFMHAGASGLLFDLPAGVAANLVQRFQCIILSTPMPDTTVAKFVPLRRATDWLDFQREAHVQRRLCTQGTLKPHVPRLHFAGWSGEWCVLVMAHVAGVTLAQHLLDEDYVGRRLFTRLERMLYLCWLTGVVHADLHYSNILLRRLPRGVGGLWPVLLDFGNAVCLPDDMVRRLERTFRWYNTASDVYFDQLSLYVRKVMGARGVAKFNPDGLTLRLLENRLSDDCSRRDLRRKRYHTWAND